MVDDDLDACRNLSDILTDQGYDVQTVGDGASALKLIRDRTFDLALLDFKLPGMDGLSLYRAIKAVSPSTVAILITAFVGTAEPEAREAGTWKILSKPVDLTLLLSLIGEAVQQPLVLVVDDDHELCANLKDLLQERGYRVDLAHTATSARELVRRQPSVRVVLLDLRLPEGDCTEVLSDLRESCPEAHTILITGHRQELQHLIKRVLNDGADAVCYKPFDPQELLETVQRLSSPAAPPD